MSMKTEIEYNSSVLVITDHHGEFAATIEIETGEIIELEHSEATIDDLYRFVHAARSRYRKFLTSKEAEDFKL